MLDTDSEMVGIARAAIVVALILLAGPFAVMIYCLYKAFIA